MMTSPIHSESDSYDTTYQRSSKRSSIFRRGLLLLEDAERAPEYLRLTIDSDPDEPDLEEENRSDSEEDVVVLGEKRPTYKEITLEEDDEGEVKEKVVEKEKEEPPPKTEEEPVYDCPFCDKSFRVESLLKFHIKMHNSSVPVATSSEMVESLLSSTVPSSVHNSERTTSDKPKKKRLSVDNHSESGSNPKSSHKHKIRREKHKRHKHKKHKRSVST